MTACLGLDEFWQATEPRLRGGAPNFIRHLPQRLEHRRDIGKRDSFSKRGWEQGMLSSRCHRPKSSASGMAGLPDAGSCRGKLSPDASGLSEMVSVMIGGGGGGQ